MFLSIAVEADAIGAEALQVDNGRRHTIAGKSIQRPYQHHVEVAPGGIGEQPSVLFALLGTLAAALVLDVFGDHRVAHALAP